MLLGTWLYGLSWHKWAILLGGIFLLVGLGMAFLSARQNAKAMGEKHLRGQITLSEEEDSPEQHAKDVARARADCLFWLGLVLTSLGVILQTVGSLY
jgi:hypothetical protein